jgi:hypothetical protein
MGKAGDQNMAKHLGRCQESKGFWGKIVDFDGKVCLRIWNQ